jgi:hypothetical protein
MLKAREKRVRRETAVLTGIFYSKTLALGNEGADGLIYLSQQPV